MAELVKEKKLRAFIGLVGIIEVIWRRKLKTLAQLYL
jgi:hypothetical protein